MTEILSETQSKQAFSEQEWEELCRYFKDSVMAQTSLTGLASNIGRKWPIRGKEEIPEKYIHRSLEELKELPEFYGKGNRLELLYDILVQTRHLDDPFMEMTEHLENVGRQKVDSPQLLQQMGVPGDFPVELMSLSEKTRTTCHEGGYETLNQLVAFLQENTTASQLNEEFRLIRNCLDQMDAVRLGQYLPIREGARGIYLAEALGQIARQLSPAQAATLVYAYKIPTTNLAWGEDIVLPKAEALALIAKVKKSARKYFDLMPDQCQDLHCALQSGLSSSVRFFVTLNYPDLEGLARAIAMAAMDTKPRFKGLLGNFLT